MAAIEMSRGTDRPAAATACMTPISIWLLATKIAVGRLASAEKFQPDLAGLVNMKIAAAHMLGMRQ